MQDVPAPPHGRTARRLTWRFLPAPVRAEIEHRCGGTVELEASQEAGYTPGFASVLQFSNGQLFMVKAASLQAQRLASAAYRAERKRHRSLPPDAPTPRLLWSHVDEWVVLCFEYVESQAPQRPWQDGELSPALDMCDRLGKLRAPLGFPTLADEIAPLARAWESLGNQPHYHEAHSLACGVAEHLAGDRLVHTDLRSDNLLLCPDGRALACDWSQAVTGPGWVDTVTVLLEAHGDGHDADALLAQHPRTRDVDPKAIDAFLALLAGYFLHSASGPVPSWSPHLRTLQDWMGSAAWSWLCTRRGWTSST